MSFLDGIIDEIAPPAARGRRAKPISAAIRRELNEGDIKALWDLPAGGLDSSVPPLVRLRHQHHFLARLIAEGKPNVESSLITGMSPSRISILKNDPAFSELIEYYKQQAGEAYVDVHERLAVLGLSSIEELMDRLQDSPEGFSARELMELAALGLDRSGHGPTTKVQASVSVLTPEVLAALKKEIEVRSNGTVRSLTQAPNNQGPVLGPVIDHEPLAEAASTEGSESKGPDV